MSHHIAQLPLQAVKRTGPPTGINQDKKYSNVLQMQSELRIHNGSK
jgi:hypothetical protein